MMQLLMFFGGLALLVAGADLLVRGAAAVIAPLSVQQQAIRQDVPLMLASGVLLLLLSLDGSIGGFDSALLCALLVAYTVFVVWQSRADDHSAPTDVPAQTGRTTLASWPKPIHTPTHHPLCAAR